MSSRSGEGKNWVCVAVEITRQVLLNGDSKALSRLFFGSYGA